jgi:hypothetical protein
MIGQFAPTAENGTVAARKGSAVATTTRLRALLRITACRAAKRNMPISSGSRNSTAAETDETAKRANDGPAAGRGDVVPLIRHNVGCCVEDTLYIKKIDEDFFD